MWPGGEHPKISSVSRGEYVAVARGPRRIIN